MHSDYSTGFWAMLALQSFWILAGISWLFRRGDEVPIIVSSFLGYVASYRYYAVVSNGSEGVSLSNFGFGAIDLQALIVALYYIVFGESVFLATYMLAQNRRVTWKSVRFSPKLIVWLRTHVLIFAPLAMALAVISKGRVGEMTGSGVSMLQMSGYLYQLPMMLISVGILLAMLWKLNALALMWHKALAALLFYGLFSLTYGPSGRFQFIGWMLGGLVVLATGFAPRRRAAILSAGACAIMAVFAVAGAARNPDGDAVERARSAEDGNMLDGFVFIQQVYPMMLPYSMGTEHLDILLRPIPRALWPGKPVGGYMNKLGFGGLDAGFSLGISPTLFGSFYQEGAGVGIFILSVLYALVFAAIIRVGIRAHPAAGLLIRGVTAAAIIPLFRGGDLPGIFAWLGMAFWPCVLLLWWKRQEFRLVKN